MNVVCKKENKKQKIAYLFTLFVVLFSYQSLCVSMPMATSTPAEAEEEDDEAGAAIPPAPIMFAPVQAAQPAGGMPFAPKPQQTFPAPQQARAQALQAPIVLAPQAVQVVQAPSAVERLYKNELDQVHKGMSEIDRLQDKLDAQIEEIVKKIEDAQVKVSEAKKMSFAILKEESEKKAGELFEKINEKMKEIKEAQDQVQGDLNQNFLETVSASKIEMSKMEGIIANLKAKLVNYQAAPIDLSAKPAAGEQRAEGAKKNEEPSITASVMNLFSTIAAKIIRVSKAAFTWIMGSSSSEEVKKKPELLAEGVKRPYKSGLHAMGSFNSVQQKPLGIVPATYLIPGIAFQPKNLREFKSAAQVYISTFDLLNKQLDQMRLIVVQQHQPVKERFNQITSIITTTPLIKNYLESKKKQEEEVKPPRWKTTILKIVDKALDMVVGVVRFVARFMKSFYSYFFSGIVNKFSHDVETKLETMEKAKPGEA